MNKSLKILISISAVFDLVSMVGLVLIETNVIPAGNLFPVIIATEFVAWVLLLLVLRLRSKTQ